MAETDDIRRQVIAQRRAELLTVAEYATVIRQHEKTIRRRIQRGIERGAVQVGGAWRVDTSFALPRKL